MASRGAGDHRAWRLPRTTMAVAVPPGWPVHMAPSGPPLIVRREFALPALLLVAPLLIVRRELALAPLGFPVGALPAIPRAALVLGFFLLHDCLCSFQCARWQSWEQYFACLHRPHVFAAPGFPHFAQVAIIALSDPLARGESRYDYD